MIRPFLVSLVAAVLVMAALLATIALVGCDDRFEACRRVCYPQLVRSASAEHCVCGDLPDGGAP